MRPLIRRLLDHALRQRGYAIVPVTEDNRALIQRVNDRSPLAPELEAGLQGVPPRLRQLRDRYDTLDLPVTTHSQWRPERVRREVDLRWFRGDSPIIWQYLEDRRLTRLKYHAWLRYVHDVDGLGLLQRLEEDGSFGCWTFEYPGWPPVSRDLLDSVVELNFLASRIPGFGEPGHRVLDVGAGYGRLAHRALTAFPEIDYWCADAIAESTFLCEFHLRHRGLLARACVLELPEAAEAIEGERFDTVVNVHSFSECTHQAVAWWMERLQRAEVGHLLVVPNEPTELLTTEVDGSRRDFAGLLEGAGFELVAREPTIRDEATRELLGVDDHFHLFRRS